MITLKQRDIIKQIKNKRCSGESYYNIGKQLNLSAERVRQLDNKIEKLLSSNSVIYDNLRKYMNENSISIKYLADICCCSRYEMCKILNGKSNDINIINSIENYTQLSRDMW